MYLPKQGLPCVYVSLPKCKQVLLLMYLPKQGLPCVYVSLPKCKSFTVYMIYLSKVYLRLRKFTCKQYQVLLFT